MPIRSGISLPRFPALEPDASNVQRLVFARTWPRLFTVDQGVGESSLGGPFLFEEGSTLSNCTAIRAVVGVTIAFREQINTRIPNSPGWRQPLLLLKPLRGMKCLIMQKNGTLCRSHLRAVHTTPWSLQTGRGDDHKQAVGHSYPARRSEPLLPCSQKHGVGKNVGNTNTTGCVVSVARAFATPSIPPSSTREPSCGRVVKPFGWLAALRLSLWAAGVGTR